MKMVFIADARSPIARNWISYFVGRGHKISIISPYMSSICELEGVDFVHVPFRFAKFHDDRSKANTNSSKKRAIANSVLELLRTGPTAGRLRNILYWVEPLWLFRQMDFVRNIIVDGAPDLVHAMRIPFEGIFAAYATPLHIPLLVSIWGNDLTLFANKNPLVSRQTKYTLRRVTALHTDCVRDAVLAQRWGFESRKPTIILPGAGGIKINTFREDGDILDLGVPKGTAVVVNPRGFRDYVRNDAFFKAIPIVLRKHPKVIFVCSSMEGNPIAERWVAQLGIEENVRLLPPVSHHRMAEIFRSAQVTVSPSVHDGTPNSLLEAMACGCFPVAGDIESVREWITDGVNGLLCDPSDPVTLANRIIRALDDDKLRAEARAHNRNLIAERAEYYHVMNCAEQFYQKIVNHNGVR